MSAETIRIVSFNLGLDMAGPGVLLHKLERNNVPRLIAAASIIQLLKPDVLILQEFDHDLHGLALGAFARELRKGPDGIDLPYHFAPEQNAGVPSGFDMDRDGRLNEPEDAWGYGRYRGQAAMAILSRFKIETADVREFSQFLWRDLPGAVLPKDKTGQGYYSSEVLARLPLAYRGTWQVPIRLETSRRLVLLVSHVSPPVFDGAENRNGLRNRDELRFWQMYLEGQKFADNKGHVASLPGGPVVLAGTFNADPERGDGSHHTIAQLLNHARLQDPLPGQVTANWPGENRPGALRVDYVLPDVALQVLAAGVWRQAETDGFDHFPVWVDIANHKVNQIPKN